MKQHHSSAPLCCKFFTPGVIVLLGFVAMGILAAGYRLLFGLQATTNLDNQHPWGIWIAIDVATGVALAAGGFTAAALTHIFHRRRYEVLMRPALLTAMLGYTFVVLGLMMDLGRYYNIWHPAWPTMWQGNSVLFEVGMCVMVYLNVLYIEFVPIICERFMGKVKLPGPLSKVNGLVEWALELMYRILGKVMFLFIVAGVVLSCMHQSSLGALMLIAGNKMNALWYTPILPLLFLLSAIAVGFPMVIFESMLASWSFGRKPEMEILAPLSRLVVVLLGIYGATKLCDLVIREAYVNLFDGSIASRVFLFEMGLGVIMPFLMLLSSRVRRSSRLLFLASSLIVIGVAINRVDVFLVAYTPPYATVSYFPSVWEILMTLGFLAGLMLAYRIFVVIFPVLPRYHLSPATRKPVASALMLPGILGLCAVLGGNAFGANSMPPTSGTTGNCSTCHSTDRPSKEDLIVGKCGRHTSVANMQAAGNVAPPDFFILDELSQLYVPVVFPHRLHAEMESMGEGCSICHHNNADGKIESCHTCHNGAPNTDNLRQPDLKGAYHRQCLACHREWSHETACVFCHAKRTPGQQVESQADVIDITSRLHPNVTTPEKWIYDTPAMEEGMKVTFHHKDHVEFFGQRCVDCHVKENCSRCHNVNGTERKEKADPHESCAKCHQNEIDNDCNHCHMKQEAPRFDHVKRAGFMLEPFHQGVGCQKCHKDRKASFAGLKRDCSSCHTPDWTPSTPFDHTKTGVLALDENHQGTDCIACHPDGMGKPTKCDSCHELGWKFPDKVPGTLIAREKDAAKK